MRRIGHGQFFMNMFKQLERRVAEQIGMSMPTKIDEAVCSFGGR